VRAALSGIDHAMKVLMIMESSLQKGGASIAFKQQAGLLSRHGHDIAYFTMYDESNSPQSDTIPCANFSVFEETAPASRTKPLALWQDITIKFSPQRASNRLKQAITKFKPDLVHFHCVKDFQTPEFLQVPCQLNTASLLTVHDSWVSCPSVELLKGGKEPCEGPCALDKKPGTSCATNHCIPSLAMRTWRIHKFRRLVSSSYLSTSIDLVLAPSPAMARTVLESQQMPEERIKTVYNTAAPELYARALEPQQPPTQTYFLASGRLAPNKGFRLLVEAFKELPSIPLVIIGEGVDGFRLESLIRERRLQNIRLLDWKSQAEMWQYYQNCYASLLPSFYFENAALVILDSLAHARPVIGARTGGTPDFVRDGQTGLIYDRYDVEGLKTHVRRLWANPALAEQLGRQGHEYFVETFAPERSYQALMAVFEESLARHARAVTVESRST
jgi:glycosyltransferase involved in cell wall biosynthesis